MQESFDELITQASGTNERSLELLSQGLAELNSSPEKAIEKIKQSTVLTDSIWPMKCLGHSYLITEKYQDAINCFNYVLEKTPNDLDSRTYLANSYLKNKNFEQAKQECEKIIEKEQEHKKANYILGTVYKETGELEKAVQQYEFVIKKGIKTKIEQGWRYIFTKDKFKRLEQRYQREMQKSDRSIEESIITMSYNQLILIYSSQKEFLKELKITIGLGNFIIISEIKKLIDKLKP